MQCSPASTAASLTLVARDTPEPSVFAHEILNAKPYAFLDDAPLEERRTQAVMTRRAGEPSSAGDLGALDPAAIERVRDEVRPEPVDPHEMHDVLMSAGFVLEDDLPPAAREHLAELRLHRRATPAQPPHGARIWLAAERIPELRAVLPGIDVQVEPPASRAARSWTRDDALVEILRGRLMFSGPITAAALAAPLGLTGPDVEAALLALEGQGVILRGRFSVRGSGAHAPISLGEEWCDRSLLARIHRYTLNRLRAEIEPVSIADFMRFLFAWQHLEPATRLTGLDGLREVLGGLDGFELAAGAWERTVLPARIDGYEPSMLDMLCLSGEIAWMRLSAAARRFTATAARPGHADRALPARAPRRLAREPRRRSAAGAHAGGRARARGSARARRLVPARRRVGLRARHGCAAPGDRGARRQRTRSLGWFLRLAQPVDDRAANHRARAQPIHRPMDRHTGRRHPRTGTRRRRRRPGHCCVATASSSGG